MDSTRGIPWITMNLVVILLFISTTVTCQLNPKDTDSRLDPKDIYTHLNQTGSPGDVDQLDVLLPAYGNASEDDWYLAAYDPTTPPIWCPDHYKLIWANDVEMWYQWCRPQSCVQVPYQENTTEQIVSSDTVVTANRTSSTARLCVPKLSKEFQECSKIVVSKSKLEVLPNGTLWNEQDGRLVRLGDFFDNGDGTVTLCKHSTAGAPEVRGENPYSCALYDFPKEDFQIFSNQTLYIRRTNSYVEPSRYHLATDNSSAITCIKVPPSLHNCRAYAPLPSDYYELRPNMDLYDSHNSETLPFGAYYIAYDRSLVLSCGDHEDTKQTRKETLYLYGSAAVVSAFCLFLALVIYLMFPSLNYHTKALLCLAFSLMVMYIVMAVRSFSGGFFSPAANRVVFAFQYIFALAAFFWLSALAYDLWKVFSEVRGTIIPGQNAKRKRAFFAKCLYSWGIPTLMCIIIIIISYYPEAQEKLDVYLQLDLVTWFLDSKTMLAFFYGPILVLLIVNLAFFILTIVNIRRSSSGTEILNKKISRKLLRVYFKIFVVMGLTWFAEIISWFAQPHTDEVVWYVSDLINCLQGVVLFVVYVCKKKTLKVIKGRLGLISPSQATESTSSKERAHNVQMVCLQNVQVNQTGAH